MAVAIVSSMSYEPSPLVHAIIGAAIAVHRELGPGLFENVYQQCFAYELGKRNIPFDTQVPLPVRYDGLDLGCVYRADFLVADEAIVELKAVDKVLPLHEAQVLTYLRLSRRPRALLINFNVRLLKEGVRSFVGRIALASQ